MLTDPRLKTLARLLIRHSVRLQPNEHVLIEAFDIPEAMVAALIREAREASGHAHLAWRSTRLMRELTAGAEEENLEVWAACDRMRMEQMQAYIGIRGAANVSEMSGIDDAQMKRHGRLYAKPVHYDQRVNHTKWCVLRWPTPSMSQLAQSGTEEFEDFYFDVCTLDYAKMSEAAAPLVDRMKRSETVRILGPGDTDLSFAIGDIPIVPCCGEYNIPDGECFTAPVRDSVNGVIAFNTPTIYNGTTFENIRLTFENGKIINAETPANEDRLQAILDTDEGARYVGEFAIAFNPYIRDAMKDILFDEKIAGSLHFTPGRAYEEADNGNRSEIHWDLVLIQRPEYGGGELYFDGELVRKDGLFVTPDLLGLNPDALTV